MAEMLVRPNGSRRFFGDFLGVDPFRNASSVAGYGFEITKTETGYAVELPVPGFKPDQIDITVEDRVLTIAGRTERRSFTRALCCPTKSTSIRSKRRSSTAC